MSPSAIFLDRDNTLNADPEGYIRDPERICLLPKVREVVDEMGKAGYLLFLLTNQSGVGRGWFTLEDVQKCNKRLCELLGSPHVFKEICASTGTPERPDSYRKPSPKFLFEMAEKYALNLKKCWVIGDKESDVKTASNAGSRGIWIHQKSADKKIFAGEEKACISLKGGLDAAWAFIRARDGADSGRT